MKVNNSEVDATVNADTSPWTSDISVSLGDVVQIVAVNDTDEDVIVTAWTLGGDTEFTV